RITQCLPWPGQDTRVVAGNFHCQIFQASAVGIVVEIAALPAVQQGLKSLFAPSLEGCLDTLRDLGPGWEGIVEELFQIRAQIEAEIPVRTALDLERLWRRDDRLLGSFAVRAPHLAAVLGTSAAQMTDDERVHPLFLGLAQRFRDPHPNPLLEG